MKRTMIGVLAVVVGVVVLTVGAQTVWGAAQPAPTGLDNQRQGSGFPPTILAFTSSVSAITLAEAEAGTMSAGLAWETAGVTSGYSVALHAYELGEWVALEGADGLPQPANGTHLVQVRHPLTFATPTYRLSIVDARGQIVDERFVVIDYVVPDPAPVPVIDVFRAAVTGVDVNALTQGTAAVTVQWQVSQRQLGMHLVFEQVLDAGRAVSVEQPRSLMWVPSVGGGAVMPVLPPTGQPVRLRLRVMDVVDGTVLAEQTLDLPVTGSLAPPTGVPAAPPVSSNPARIVSFTVNPLSVNRGGTVTLNWQVDNALEVVVWRLNPVGQFAEGTTSSGGTGSWTVTLGQQYTTSATFVLFATDALGSALQQAVAVEILCPYTYFFGPAPDLVCPAGEAATVEAAFQQFERGYMLWRADTSEIYVLYGTGQVGRYQDVWQGEEVTYPEAAPAGLMQPVRGFGRVWVDHPEVRNGLGWAATQEQGYNMTFQRTGDYRYARLYLTLPDQSIVYLVENTWNRR